MPSFCLPMYYSKDKEEWQIDPVHIRYMFDGISNRLLTVLKEDRNNTGS